MLFSTTGCVVPHETLEDEWWGVITAYKLAVLEILRNLYQHNHVRAIPTCRVYRLYDVIT